MARKFYRTVYSIEVLSEEPLPDSMSLEKINYEITEGHCSGQFLDTVVEKMNGKRMAKLLEAQGTNPEFFMLDSDGKDIEY